VVFDNIEDYKARIDTEQLEVDEKLLCWSLKNVGPKGYPENAGSRQLWGSLKSFGTKEVKDNDRISDGRMSEPVLVPWCLHVSPEAGHGGNFSVIEMETYHLDVRKPNLTVAVSEE